MISYLRGVLQGVSGGSVGAGDGLAEWRANQPSMSARTGPVQRALQQDPRGVPYGQPRDASARPAYGVARPENPSLGRSLEKAAGSAIEFLAPRDQVEAFSGRGEMNPYVFLQAWEKGESLQPVFAP